MKPTEAQIKEFWELLGVHFKPVSYATMVHFDDGREMECVPDTNPSPRKIDLNNLFRYAVPKDTDIQISTGRGLAGEVNRWVVAIKEKRETQSLNKGWCIAENKDPALALFWAIYEVIKCHHGQK